MVKSGAVIFARDVGRLARFYEGVVSLRQIDHADGAIRLENAAFQLVIHPLPSAFQDSTPSPEPQEPRHHNPIKLVFAVDSLDHVRAQIAFLGGGMAPASSAFVWAGFRACDGHDPEGNVIQFREPA